MNLILKGYWSNNPISVDEVIQNPELVLRVPVGTVSLADVDKAYVDEQDSLLGNEFATALQALDDKKANATAVTQALSTKADLIDGVIPANQLPSFNVDSVGSVNGQTGVVVLDADDVGATTQGYVDTQDDLIINSLTLKADTNYVDTQDSLLQDQIDLKANTTDVNESLALKANTIDVNEALDLKANTTAVSQALALKADAMATSQSLALKADLIGGLIPSSQLPSYVDDVLSFQSLASFPVVGEDGKIYVAEDVNKTYRWGGSSYVEIGGGGVALGETSSTAYRGDNGKIAYDHSLSQGNPHNATTTDIDEGTKLFFTESRVNQTVLTGLNTSTASPALATDQLLAAIGKLQAQINSMGSGGGGSSGGITWVDITTLAGYSASSVDQANSKIEVSKQNGMIWIRGYFVLSGSVAAASPIVRYTQSEYLVDSTYATGAANISPLSMSAVMLMTPSSGGLGTISYLKFNPSRVAGNSTNFNLSPYPTSLAAQGYFIVPTCLGKALNP